MSPLEEKYNEYLKFGPSSDFPNFYEFLLYESGGDFKIYAEIIGYETFKDFTNDFQNYIENE